MSGKTVIKFGTSGWRAIMADEFTFENVRIVTQAIADYLKEKNLASRPVIVGYDTRFMSEKFGIEACGVLAGNGIKSIYSVGDAPTPVISYEIIRRLAGGGINFTASHNPSSYNGIKFNPSNGAPAPKEVTCSIEEKANAYMNSGYYKYMKYEDAVKAGLIEQADLSRHYLKRIRELIDFNLIKKSKIKIAVDLMHGAGSGYLDGLLEEIPNVKVFNKNRDALFNGHPPEPSLENMMEMAGFVKKSKYNIGIGLDGDADRFGIVDSGGRFLNPNCVLSLLYYHLIKNKGLKGDAVRSVVTTHLLDAIAEKYGFGVHEVPVGFKFVGEEMLKPGRIIGGEESGGLTVSGHIPEKDGILACLLMVEMVASRKRTLTEELEEICALMGNVVNDRVNVEVTEKIKSGIWNIFNDDIKEIAGIKVKKVVKLDGVKYLLEDNSWLGVRISGTENIVRIYAEANSPKKLKAIGTEAKNMLQVCY